jgi:hypothetical protein
MAEDKVKDEECTKLLAYSPPAPAAASVEGQATAVSDAQAAGSDAGKKV